MTDLLWQGTLDRGLASLRGNCGPATQGWCNVVVARPEQIQIGPGSGFGIPDPPVGPNWIRLEVRFGDVAGEHGYLYSGSRATLTGPDVLWFNEGDEVWVAGAILIPTGSVWAFPKHDELGSWKPQNPTSGPHLDGGAILHIHHEPFGGGVEQGSAPFYFSGNGDDLRLDLAGPKTVASHDPNVSPYIDIDEPYLSYRTPMRRGQPQNLLFHIRFSSDPTRGFVEAWCDKDPFVPRYVGPTMYRGTRMYLVASLYRHQSIGDPSLHFADGSRVFPQDDGTPGVVYHGQWNVGRTQASVSYPIAPPPEAPPVTPSPPALAQHPALDLLIDLRVRLLKEIVASETTLALANAQHDALVKMDADIKALLDRGQRWDTP